MKIEWGKLLNYPEALQEHQWGSFPSQMLILANDIAEYIDCTKFSGTCYMNIVEHSRSDIVAVCHRDTLGCRIDGIKRNDLKLWKLDIDSFLDRTARSLAATHQDWFNKNIEKIDVFDNLWRLGQYVAYDKQEYPAFIVLTNDSLELLNILRFISITFNKNFLILTPLKAVFNASAEAEILRFTNIFLALEDIFVENSEYGLELSGDVQKTIYNWILQFSPWKR